MELGTLTRDPWSIASRLRFLWLFGVAAMEADAC